MDLQRETVTLPVPFADIENLLRTKRLDRTSYLAGRRAVKAWHESVIGQLEQLSPPTEKDTDMEFIDRQLTAEEIEAAAVWMDVDSNDVSIRVNEMLLDGYRVTFTFDNKNTCIVVTVIGKAVDNPNFDRAMTTRHGTVRKALHLALYKHWEIFQGKAWGESGPSSLYG